MITNIFKSPPMNNETQQNAFPGGAQCPKIGVVVLRQWSFRLEFSFLYLDYNVAPTL